MSVIVDVDTADDDAATVIDDVWGGCVSIGSQWAMGAAKLIKRALPFHPLRTLADWPVPLAFA